MTTTSTLRSVPVHGGLSSPIQRILPRVTPETAGWSSLPRLQVSETDRTTLYRIGDGTLSPLLSPMSETDYRSVLERGAIERGGRRFAWTIPIVLPITDAEAKAAGASRELALAHE